MGESENGKEIVERLGNLSLATSKLEDLQLAGIIDRKASIVAFRGYTSDNDDTDEDEDDGELRTERRYHDNGNPCFYKTYQINKDVYGSEWERMVEEKHFDVDGVCRVDVHFALGQPYLYRKHYFPNQRLKSESVFWVDDEKSLKCRKIGWWRQYYDNGNVKSEIQYNDKGVRIGFAKRYGSDGTIEWVKDYTKEYEEKMHMFNDKKGKLAFNEIDAALLLGFDGLPKTMSEVNSRYRQLCVPIHPDKKPEPEATETFIRLSRARDVLREYFEKMNQPVV
eukprot:Plantae.Rhodophyta-Purpureofilum_apyrenoidigerum.ctg10099.p2 GENE.Plantae.Rhodophyta-Purpureofilum_apyrenoidigerum.ctg10099~~Plantae.Rhodophyta-Purpureofilum_apyrenoidigerum.ctg10099.p2  ORF type:complete len:280 (-),score=60.16 Plantae.Rhodophyta-Purpureofilum_apyrenoidigerum.ctg10099:1609-2448(-)